MSKTLTVNDINVKLKGSIDAVESFENHIELIDYKTVRSGYCAEGVPANIDIVKSLQGSISRRIAMTSSKRRKLKETD
mgnify:CR=1 FL=1